MRLLLAFVVGILLHVSAASANYPIADDSFMSRTLKERVTIQTELTWAGDYNALIDAEFGPRTYAAIQAFQRRNGFPVTGVITKLQRKVLWSEVSELLDEIGFETVKDTRANLELAIPKRLAPNSMPTRRGTRWSSPSGDFVLESFFVPAGEASFHQVYRQLRAEDGRRSIHYSTIRDDLFVVTGNRSGQPFYSRFSQTPSGSRGISISWASGLMPNMEGVVLGLANSVFDIADSVPAPNISSLGGPDPFWAMVGSFQSRLAAVTKARKFAARLGDSSEVPVSVFLTDSGLFAVALGPFPRELADHVVAALRESSLVPDAWLSSGTGFVSEAWQSVSDSPPSAAQKRPVRVATGTGFFISSEGLMLTNAHVVSECLGLDVPGHGRAHVLLRDDKRDLAVVRVQSIKATPHAIFQSRSIRVQSDVVVLGYPLAHILGGALNVTSGQVSSLAGVNGDRDFMLMTAPVQPGNSGGPVLDMSGRVVGVATARISDQKVFGDTGVLPQNMNLAIRNDAVTAFLSASNVDYQIENVQDRFDRSDVAERGATFTHAIICLQ